MANTFNNTFNSSGGKQTIVQGDHAIGEQVMMSLVVEWAQDHQDELLANWNSISDTGEYRKITPLV